jgi:hypothetical protein
MKRLGWWVMSVVLVVSLWVAPAGAQDKYTMGMAPAT